MKTTTITRNYTNRQQRKAVVNLIETFNRFKIGRMVYTYIVDYKDSHNYILQVRVLNAKSKN